MSATATKSDPAADLAQDGMATIPEAARFLSVSRSTLYTLLNSGSLPSARIGGLRAVRVPWAAVRKLAAESIVTAGQ